MRSGERLQTFSPRMRFPSIAELPGLMSAGSWTWEPFKPPAGEHTGFWIGTDTSGTKWLVKMRGSRYAHREHSFGAFAQRLGISCQSSVFLRLPPDAEPLLADSDSESEPYQLALWLLPEHQQAICSSTCPLPLIQDELDRYRSDPILALQDTRVRNLMDWARMSMLAHLCGANEPSDRLITPDHSLVLVDNEQMFSTSPADIWTCGWLLKEDGSISPLAIEVATDLCRRVVSIKDEDLSDFASYPEGYRVSRPAPVTRILREAKLAAAAFLQRPRLRT